MCCPEDGSDTILEQKVPMWDHLRPIGAVHGPIGVVFCPMGAVHAPMGVVYGPMGAICCPMGPVYNPWAHFCKLFVDFCLNV